MTQLVVHQYLGKARAEDQPSPLPSGRWVTFTEEGDGLEYRFAPGLLGSAGYLTADFLLDGNELAIFILWFKEGEDGPEFGYSFGLLNQCQARLRMPLEAANLNRWMYPREGALLKPLTHGQRVDPARVDRVRLVLLRFSGHPARLCLTNLTHSEVEPPVLSDPLLSAGPLLDELGQSTLHAWPQKVQSVEALVTGLRKQHREAAGAPWPGGFSKWGGWEGRTWRATGFFRTAFEEGRWWLVDPDGHPFWSVGLDCVDTNMDAAFGGIEKALTWLPEENGPYSAALENKHTQRVARYDRANLIRAFGSDWYAHWSEMTAGLMRSWGFNTIANWSDWRMASRAGFPYVRPLREDLSRSRTIYRNFPDVFHPDFEADAEAYAQQLVESRDDPALIGYFLQNEPSWGFSTETLAEGMLFTASECETRRTLAADLRARYGSDAALSAAWGMNVNLEQVESGLWTARLSEKARADLEAFSTVMVDTFFGTLNQKCKAVDPNHLNLGARYYTVPPQWVLKGMRGFDVFSINCYREHVPADDLAAIHDALGIPTLIGEWHFGALDVGLPASGIGRVHNQAERGKAYRVYVENATAISSCVGVHYFTLYDQSALGRFDGENYNIGFLDVCHQPYTALVEAAHKTHMRLYRLAAGELIPTQDEPEYLPRVFL